MLSGGPRPAEAEGGWPKGRDPRNLFLGLRSPTLDEVVIEPLTDTELRVAQGVDRPPDPARKVALRHPCDEVIIRLTFETGTRA